VAVTPSAAAVELRMRSCSARDLISFLLPIPPGPRLGGILGVVAVILLSSGVASAWAATSPRLIWPTYHADSLRKGENPSSVDISNPSNLNLIWVFPRGVGGTAEEAKTIVDNRHPRYFSVHPTWRNGTSPDAWSNYFYWKPINSRLVQTPNPPTYAVWQLPSELKRGSYQIYVWVPPSPQNTSQAEYTVYDDSGATKIKFDQNYDGREGVYWKLLSSRYFSFSSSGNYRVELSDTTSDSPTSNKRVVADAMKFVLSTGQEIYTSPVTAEIYPDWTWVGEDGETYTWKGRTLVAYVGTVESPVSKHADAPETGTLYCVNGVTPTITTDWESNKLYKELNKMLGTDIWHYPNKNPALRDDLEGPIQDGIYATPTIARTNDKAHELVCIAAGRDGQVYTFDAQSGELLWRGPGLTASEGPDLRPDVQRTTDRVDAFGGVFHWAPCVAPDDSTGGLRSVTWEFTDEDRALAGEPKDGLVYAVYAWMPSLRPGDKERISDATYTITFEKYDVATQGPVNTTETFTLDQSQPQNQGTWVRLGAYFNVKSVTLTNATREKTTNDQVPDKCVVFDAVKIVPETVGPFSYSSPTVNVENPKKPDSIASVVYATTANGRVLAFDIGAVGATSKKIGHLRWIYPKVRTKLVVSGAADDDQPSLGEIGATPAFCRNKLYIACASGHVRCLDNIGGDNWSMPTQAWVFPNPNADADSNESPEGFTSSCAMDPDNEQLFVGSTDGVFYCLYMNPRGENESQLRKRSPEKTSATTSPLPYGAFRYSTPAVADDKNGEHRVWAASSDGRVYTFGANPNTPDLFMQRLRVEYDDNGNMIGTPKLWYTEPSVLASIQSSIALDGKQSKDMFMYFGDMLGTLHWFNATNGTTSTVGTPWRYKGWKTEGELFSSPAVVDTAVGDAIAVPVSYVMIGCSDGRLYAFSNETDGAWGGKWAGGEWVFEGTPDNPPGRLEQIVPGTDIQFDIFPANFFESSANFEAERTVNDVETGEKYYLQPDEWTPQWPEDSWPINDPDPSHRPVLISKTMKMLPLPSGATESQIDAMLRAEAKKRRQFVFGKAARTTSSSDPNSAIYFEWGETLYLGLWNMPALEFLYGTNEQSKKTSIRFYFTNSSSGSSSGSQIRFSGIVTALKEYTVLDGSTATTKNVTIAKADPGVGTPAVTKSFKVADPVQYNGADLKRCFCLAKLEIRSTSSRPPSPGPGWTLVAEIRKKTSSAPNAPIKIETIPLAKLKMGPNGPEPVLIPTQPGGSPDSTTPGTVAYREQLLGINNPLAIRDDGDRVGSVATSLAWGNGRQPNRYDPEAHFNGNSVMVVSGTDVGIDTGKMPVIDFGVVNHGTSSREAWLGVMDRSATGTTLLNALVTPPQTEVISRFRISDRNLAWQGGLGAVKASGGAVFPWDLGPGSVDYPDIFTRYQSYRKSSDDNDPAARDTTLPALLLKWDGTKYNTQYPADSTWNAVLDPETRPDVVYITVDVPRYQPANMYGSSSGPRGYSASMEAFIDSNGDGHWDSGTRVVGKPTTYQEAYRRFRVNLRVPPDPKIEVDEQLVDIGTAPHGLGVETSWPMEFSAYNTHPLVQQWFKKITVKNAGNVNLPNVRIGHEVSLFSDRSDSLANIPGSWIISSLDGGGIASLLQPFSDEPFVSADYGYTLSKPRVGDPDPVVMSIPDSRKWETNYQYTRSYAQGPLSVLGWPTDKPLPVQVSVRVPLGSPIGTYQAPFVGVFSDLSGNGVWDSGEPFAAPTFQLKVSVRESQLTGGVTPTSLPGIDSGELPKVGDSSPAAFRDAHTGKMHLFWSTNRIDRALSEDKYPNWADPTDPRLTEFANAPWLIDHASLNWSGGSWQKAPGVERWWERPSDDIIIPNFASGAGALAQWPELLFNKDNAVVMKWRYDGADTALSSVSHASPVIVENYDVPPDAQRGRTWMAWAGTADVKVTVPNPSNPRETVTKAAQEHRIFYADVSHGNIANDPTGIFSIDHEPTMVKRFPYPCVYGDIMWMFWQGGEKGKWSIFFSTNESPSHNPADAKWTDDTRLRTPDSLVSVSSPVPIRRRFWGNLRGDTPDFTGSKDLLDVVYSGITKLDQTPDLMLGRYISITPARQQAAGYNPDCLPGRRAQPLPRVFNEKLVRDAKFGFFTSQHLAWFRLSRRGIDLLRLLTEDEKKTVMTDHVGRLAHQRFEGVLDDLFARKTEAFNSELFNLPYIRMVLPANYRDKGWPKGTVVSLTDGSIRSPLAAPDDYIVPPQVIVPDIDDATGIYTYKYPEGPTKDILGEVMIDFSAGIVRIAKGITELKNADGTVSTPELYADYTPQTWRLTRDLAVDNSPRAFIERTSMTTATNPGMCRWQNSYGQDKPAPVDRLWVFWRKAGAGVDSSTIFYSTYRVGADLTGLFDEDGKPAKPVKWIQTASGPKVANATVTGNLGPWEIDRAGTTIYFTEVDERYSSLVKSGSADVLGSGPGPIVLEYENVDGATQKVYINDAYWLPELPEQSLFGFASDTNVNEGSICAFADPNPSAVPIRLPNGTWTNVSLSKIWIFWASTRAGTTDLFWEAISPNFTAR